MTTTQQTPTAQKIPAKLSPAQFNYTLFRNLGTAIDKAIRKDKESSRGRGHFNLYVFTHTNTTVHKAPQIVTNPQSHFVQALVPQRGQPFPFATRTTPSTYLIGYDTEFQTYDDESHPNYPAKLLSHQFYCNFNGHRFGVVFLTDTSFRAIDFVRLINKIVPDDNRVTLAGYTDRGEPVYKPELSTVRIYAHFSLIESGWLSPSMRLKSEVEDFFGYLRREYVPLIQERDKEWHDSVALRKVEIRHPDAKRKQVAVKLPKASPAPGRAERKFKWIVRLKFCDSGNLIGRGISLKDLGARIGIDKVGNDNISEMETYLTTNPDDFCYYGIMDSLITAESHLWHNNEAAAKLNLGAERERAAAMSADVFRNIFQRIHGKGWKRFLGYEDATTMTISHRTFVKYYFGGRNDVMHVGPVDRAIYYDLRSAYPTALIMLPDYDCSKSYTYYDKDALLAVERMEKEPDGPFQIAGITVSFKFKENAKPTFPVRIDEPSDLPKVRLSYDTDGLIFPRSGHTTVTWPELWVARRKQYNGEDLLEELTIHSLTTFENLGTYELSDAVLNILSKRNKNDKAMDGFYKQILNFFYGKTAEGVRNDSKSFKSHDLDSYIRHSPVTCYPLSSFITGFCRTAVGELLQYFECFGITTDGFISPDTTIEQVVATDGPGLYFCRTVNRKVQHLNPFIAIDSQGDQSLFLKTRGYLLTTGGKMQSKLARAGAQTPRVAKNAKTQDQSDIIKHEQDHIKATEAFLQIVQRGRCNKDSWRSLQSIRKFFRMEIDNLLDRDDSASTAQKLTLNVNLSDKMDVADEDEDDLYKGRILSSKLLARSRNSLPLKASYKDMKVNSTFDMKRIPVDPEIKSFKWNGMSYDFVSFKTRPLDSASDFHLLRTLSKRTASHEEYVYTHYTSKTPSSTFKRIERIQIKNLLPMLDSVATEIATYFPELSGHWQEKETQKNNAYTSALQKLLALVAQVTGEAGFTVEIVPEYCLESLEFRLQMAMKPLKKSQIENSKPVGFTKTNPTEKQRNWEKYQESKGVDLLQEGYGRNYYPELEIRMKIESGIDKILAQFKKEAGIPEFATNKPPSKFLDITVNAEKRLNFLAKFGGGRNVQPGVIEREPSWMEISDYYRMLDKFHDVTECSADVSGLGAGIWKILDKLVQPKNRSEEELEKAHKKLEELYEGVVRIMKQRIRQQFKDGKRNLREQREKMPHILCSEYFESEQGDMNSEEEPEEKTLTEVVTEIAEKIIEFQEIRDQLGPAVAFAAQKGKQQLKQMKKTLCKGGF
jgi:hypothetical protein